MARPSGSRSVGTPATSTGRSRSRTKRRTTASCCASFSPRNSTSGCTTPSSLVTMTATPSKWLGREAPSKLSVSGAADVHVGGEALRVHLVGRRREDHRDARLLQEAQVAGLVARVPSKSSPRPNCVGFTKTEAATPRAARPSPPSTRLRWPACRAPIVGTKPEGARELAQRGPRLRDGPGDDHGWPPAQWPRGGLRSRAGGAVGSPPASPAPSSSRSVATCSSSSRGAASVSASRLSAR